MLTDFFKTQKREHPFTKIYKVKTATVTFYERVDILIHRDQRGQTRAIPDNEISNCYYRGRFEENKRERR